MAVPLDIEDFVAEISDRTVITWAHYVDTVYITYNNDDINDPYQTIGFDREDLQDMFDVLVKEGIINHET